MGKIILSDSVELVARHCPSCRKPMGIRRMPCNRGCKTGCAGVHKSWLCEACGRWWIFPTIPPAFRAGRKS